MSQERQKQIILNQIAQRVASKQLQLQLQHQHQQKQQQQQQPQFTATVHAISKQPVQKQVKHVVTSPRGSVSIPVNQTTVTRVAMSTPVNQTTVPRVAMSTPVNQTPVTSPQNKPKVLPQQRTLSQQPLSPQQPQFNLAQQQQVLPQQRTLSQQPLSLQQQPQFNLAQQQQQQAQENSVPSIPKNETELQDVKPSSTASKLVKIKSKDNLASLDFRPNEVEYKMDFNIKTDFDTEGIKNALSPIHWTDSNHSGNELTNINAPDNNISENNLLKPLDQDLSHENQSNENEAITNPEDQVLIRHPDAKSVELGGMKRSTSKVHFGDDQVFEVPYSENWFHRTYRTRRTQCMVGICCACWCVMAVVILTALTFYSPIN